MAFTDIPLDVILETTFFLDLHHAFRLLSTCSSFHRLLSLKDFWLKSLDRIQIIHKKHLPCPPGTVPQTLPFDAVRELSLRAYKLHCNWTSSFAKPVSIHTIPLGQENGDIRIIPGTRMVVTSTFATLSCWDTLSATCLASLDLYSEAEDDFYEFGKSPAFHQLGKSFIPLSVTGSTLFGAVVAELDYRDSEKVTFSKIHSALLAVSGDGPIDCVDVTMDEDWIGMLYSPRKEAAFYFMYSNLKDSAPAHRIKLDASESDRPIACTTFDGQFYIMYAGLEGMLRVRAAATPEEMECIAIPAPCLSLPAKLSKSSNRCYHGFPSENGVTGVHLRLYEALEPTPGSEYHKLIHTIHFLPASPSDDSGSLSMEEYATYEHFDSITSIAAGVTGRYAAMIYHVPGTGYEKPGGNRHTLGIVHYAAHPERKITFCELDPGEVEINFYTGIIALDDVLGVVYFTKIGQRENTKLYALSYV